MASPKRAFSRCTSSLSRGKGFGGASFAGGAAALGVAGAAGAAGFAAGGADGLAAAEGACEGSTGFSAAGLPTAPDAGVFEAESFSEGSLAIDSSSALAARIPNGEQLAFLTHPKKQSQSS